MKLVLKLERIESVALYSPTKIGIREFTAVADTVRDATPIFSEGILQPKLSLSEKLVKRRSSELRRGRLKCAARLTLRTSGAPWRAPLWGSMTKLQ